MSITIQKTEFNGFGCKKVKGGYYFGANLKCLRECGIILYDAKTLKVIEKIVLDKKLSVGTVYCVVVSSIDTEFVYRFFMDARNYIDPYSEKIKGLEKYKVSKSADELYSYPSEGRKISASVEDCPRLPYNECVFYQTHVRGLTMQEKSNKYKGTFLGVMKKIPYLKDLGVTDLILMPVYEFIELEKDSKDEIASFLSYTKSEDSEEKVNYWGLKKGYYFALKSSYSYDEDSEKEFIKLINELHKNNMELIMQVYFEKDLNHQYVIDVLVHYVDKYHVDGFRFCGCRDFYQDAVDCPFLSDTKLIFEENEERSITFRTENNYKNISFIGYNFIVNARKFLKGDDDMVFAMSNCVKDNYSSSAPIRFLSDFNTFSLYDLVSYNSKHNEANGENNKDGNNYNYSWNCGEEGTSKKRNIINLRLKQAKNAMLLVNLLQGTPMLRGGDEWLDTQFGNNNCWCQDNEIGWTNYSKKPMNKAFYEFTKNLLSFRKRHYILRQPQRLSFSDYLNCRLPDISLHGAEAFQINTNPESCQFAILLCGDYARQYTQTKESSLYIVINMHWQDMKFTIPVNKKDYCTKLLFVSDGSTPQDFNEENATIYEKEDYVAPGRTISIFIIDKK